MTRRFNFKTPLIACAISFSLASCSAMAASPFSNDDHEGTIGGLVGSNNVLADDFRKAYERLSPLQKKQFDSLIGMNYKTPAFLVPSSLRPPVASGSFNSFGTSVEVEILKPAEQEMLKALLCDGTLLRKCSDGQTILAHLAALVQSAPYDGKSTMNGKTLARDLIRMLQPVDLKGMMQSADNMEYHLNDKGQRKQNGIPMPGGLGEITQCPVHYTCGAAAAQVWMRLNRPEELVRITDDLFSKGKSVLNGDTLKASRSARDFHAGDTIYKNEFHTGKAGNEDRCDLDILLQSALMEKIAIGNASAYNVNSDSGGILNVVGGNSGGHPLYIKREMEKLTGQPFTYAHNLDLYKTGGAGRFLANLGERTPQADLVEMLKVQVAAGKNIMIAYQTRAGDAMALHYVTIVGYDPASDTYYYADTDEVKSDRAKMYTKTGKDMMDVLRCIIYPQ